MKTSTPESPKVQEPKSILLIGPPGGGKSTLAMQFPSVCFMDCDRNLDGPEAFLRKHNKSLGYSYVPIAVDDEGKVVEAHACFDRLMDELLKLKQEPSVKTVVIDGLTLVNEYIIRKVLKAQSKSDVAEMMPKDWIPFKSHMIGLIVARLRSLNKTTICTVHESINYEPADPKKDLLGKRVIGYDPSVQGSVVDFFGGFFTDMWRCYTVRGIGESIEFKIDMWATPLSRYLKNSMGMPDSVVVKNGELAYDKLKPYLDGKI